jgi:CheY-like chemotaxis protein
MNVLIVDDEPMTRSLLRRVLAREFGCTVVEATNGLEALSVAGDKPVSLIVTDLRMPVMDGIELLEALRQFPPLAAVPVVMMSAAREPGHVHRAIQLGVTDYLLKPLEAAKVASRLRTVVDRITRASKEATTEPNARVEIDARTPMLLADGNADFRQFFAQTMGGKRTIHQTETGVAALQRCVESRPGLVFVGSELGVLGPELLVRKLRATPDLAQTRIYAIVPRQVLEQGTTPPQVDGVITRTFVADEFRKQIDRLLSAGGKAGGILAAHPTLKTQMASAAEQVFGMMLQLEVTPSFDVEPLPVEHLVSASVRFTLPGADDHLMLALRTEREAAKTIAAGMAAAAPEPGAEGEPQRPTVAADDPLGAVAEVVSIIGGRLRRALEDAGVRATVEAPEPREGGAGNLSEGGEAGVQVTVRSLEKGHVFVLQLRTAVPAAAAAGAAPAAAPEPARAS